ncbi:SCO family protein [Candidatus Halocynthiibacter alkanivorans]|jgi:protein SCO1|uniref:SCO family protein n=1 Tax=Candidatus Halocynthiibacter alkanivorans TaxID=2267619 RepID=UPI000DF35825|nr:SCO family protein [Candidatus Halocynthiibacter alkanivorans]
MTRTRVLAATSATSVILAVGAWFAFGPGPGDQFAQCSTSQIAGGTATIGGPFELISETGETVTDKDVITKPTIVYFGYTFCPDVCPLDNARNADAVYMLQEQGFDVQPAFITIDPARDTVEVVKDYTDLFHPEMIGLTGSLEQVKAASKAYKTYFSQQADDSEFYLMNHSTFSYLMLPEQGFVEYFGRDVSAEKMAETAACYIGAA